MAGSDGGIVVRFSRNGAMPRHTVVLLALLLAACDDAKPDLYPGAALVATVRDASGAPAAGLDVFLTYGDLIPDAARSMPRSRAAFEFLGVYPTLASGTALARFHLPTPQVVTARLLDVAGEPMETLVDGQALDGGHTIRIPLETYPSGIYVVEIEAGGESVRQLVVKTDAWEEIAFHLGQTDADGVLVVTDRKRLPSLFDLPPFIVYDHEGNALGEVRLTRAAGLVAQNASGRTDGVPIILRDDRTEVAFTFAP